MPSVSKARKSAPKCPKNAKPWKTAEELEKLLADRAGEPAIRVSVFGQPSNWNAALIVPLVGNADRLARFRSVVSDLRQEFDLKAGQ